MLHPSVTYKHIMLFYEPRKKLGIECQHINQLIIFNDMCLTNDKLYTVGGTLKRLQSLSYIHTFKECLFCFGLLNDLGLVAKKRYGKITLKGKFKHKYMPTIKGKLFVSDFWEYYNTESIKLINA